MDHKGKTQLNIELDTQQSFVIQNNFSRYTTIFHDTEQFFTVHNNLSRHKTIFLGTQQSFAIQNNFLRNTTIFRDTKQFVFQSLDEDKVRYDIETTPFHASLVFDDEDDILWAWQHLFDSICNDNLRSGPFLASPICSLMSSLANLVFVSPTPHYVPRETKIEPDRRLL